MMTVVVITTLKMNNMIMMMTVVMIRNPKSDHHDHDESIIDDYCGEDGDDDLVWMTSISATTLMMTGVKITALKVIDMIMMW